MINIYPSTKKLITEFANEIDNNEWEKIYRSDMYAKMDAEVKSQFNYLMYQAGIDPLNSDKSLNYIPSYYLYNTDIREINIPDHIIAIGHGAFEDCTSLGEIILPKKLIDIASYAFYCCTSLTDINIPFYVSEINNYAFAYCPGLQSITFGPHIDRFPDFMLAGCVELADIGYQGTMEQWRDIQKSEWWDDHTGDYVIHCNDGDIEKK